jgi:hypothetical protein
MFLSLANLDTLPAGCPIRYILTIPEAINLAIVNISVTTW